MTNSELDAKRIAYLEKALEAEMQAHHTLLEKVRNHIKYKTTDTALISHLNKQPYKNFWV